VKFRSLLACALLVGLTAGAAAQETPGVTATEILIGQTMPYSGPVTAFSMLGKGEVGYFAMVNERGGINGRKIKLLSLDDGYVPPKTVELTRRLIEQDKVAFIFSSIGTAQNTAIARYLNDRKIPQLFIGSGADKWGDYNQFPYTTMGVQASFRAEARVYARYALERNPNAKFAILHQNDDFGRDYALGLKDVFGDKYASRVTEATYEFTDPTIDSQIVTLQGSGADTFIFAGTPKFAAQTIRKAYDIGWKPTFFLCNVAIWVSTVMIPAGPEKGIGIISSAYVKDPTDPGWNNDPGMKTFKEFMTKYVPDGDQRDQNYVNSYNSAMVLEQVLKQAGNDLSRENIMKQALNLKDLELPMLLPGIKVNTSQTDHRAVEQMQLMRWDGKQWVRFGALVETK
jgi:branched-chain amino acid transport system substrate-binding protein